MRDLIPHAFQQEEMEIELGVWVDGGVVFVVAGRAGLVLYHSCWFGVYRAAGDDLVCVVVDGVVDFLHESCYL